MKMETRIAGDLRNAGSSTCDLHDPSVGGRDDQVLASRPDPLGIPEKVGDPDRENGQDEGEQPEWPRAPIDRERVAAGRDERRDDNEDHPFFREAHECGLSRCWPVMRRKASRYRADVASMT
jgi:hypothetical protein